MIAQLVSGGLEGILKGVKGLIEEFHMDPKEAAKLEIELIKAETAIDRVQSQVNEAEARHPNWFVAGWRPFVGWTCGVGLGYQVILLPLMGWVARLNEWPVPPPIDASLLTTVLLGMLGLGGIRAYEKMKGVSRG